MNNRTQKLYDLSYTEYPPTELDELFNHQQSYVEVEVGEVLFAINEELADIEVIDV